MPIGLVFFLIKKTRKNQAIYNSVLGKKVTGTEIPAKKNAAKKTRTRTKNLLFTLINSYGGENDKGTKS